MKKTKRYAEGDEVDGNFYEAGSGSESDYKDDQTSETPTPSAKAAAPKRAIVTKEQLAASPYDNLRDYLNAQQNLKRRDGSASSKPAPKAEAPAPKAESKPAPKAEAPAPKEEAKPAKKTSTNPNVPTSEEAAANRKAAAEKIGKVTSSIGSYLKDTFTPSGRMAVEQRREANRATSDNYKSRAPGAKKGGMASSRGDGIAQKGKTKGRFC